MKNRKKTIIGLLTLTVVVAILLSINTLSRPSTKTGAKTLNVSVVHRDGGISKFNIKTDAEYLSAALLENNIVEDNQTEWGLYILTADGETVDETKKEWWCITKNGERILTGASETVISNGDTFELTFTVGYD